MPNRRNSIAAGLGAILGSSWLVSASLPDREPSPSPPAPPSPNEPQPTPTSTPPGDPVAPTIIGLNLLSDWSEEGDVVRNRIQSIKLGNTVVLGVRYRTWVHEGKQHDTIKIEVSDEGGGDIVNRETVVNRRIQENGPIIHELAFELPTIQWSLGVKRVKAVIRDEVTRFVSEPSTASFPVKQMDENSTNGN